MRVLNLFSCTEQIVYKILTYIVLRVYFDQVLSFDAMFTMSRI